VLALCGLALALGAVYLMFMSLGANVGTPESRALFTTTPIAEIAGVAVSLLMFIIGLSAIAFGELIEVVFGDRSEHTEAKGKSGLTSYPPSALQSVLRKGSFRRVYQSVRRKVRRLPKSLETT